MSGLQSGALFQPVLPLRSHIPSSAKEADVEEH